MRSIQMNNLGLCVGIFIMSMFSFFSCVPRSSTGELEAHTTRVPGSDIAPRGSDFNQLYNKVYSSMPKSRFGPAVRIVEFEYKLKESYHIDVRITSGYNEGPIKGILKIAFDQVEIEYIDSFPIAREYVESIQYGENRKQNININPSILVNRSLPRVSRNNTNNKVPTQTVSKSQIFNSASFPILKRDLLEISKARDLEFTISFEESELIIVPNKSQLKIIQKQIKKYLK